MQNFLNETIINVNEKSDRLIRYYKLIAFRKLQNKMKANA